MNDAAGRTFARQHGLGFPFSNDTYDAAGGRARLLELTAATVCTGIIRVGYAEPLHDHAVDCEALVAAAARRRLAVAVWRDESGVVQVS